MTIALTIREKITLIVKNIYWQVINRKVISIFILFLVLIAVIGIKIFQIATYRGSFTQAFTQNDFKNSKLPLYIAEEQGSYKFGTLQNINGNQIPEILSGPIDFVWQPQEYPLLKKTAVSADIQDQGDWDISVVCPKCDIPSRYVWTPFFRSKLIGSNIEKTFSNNLSIYSQIPLKNKTDSSDITEWMKQNIPEGSNVSILDNVYEPSGLVTQNVDYKEGATTTIKQTLRGPQTFYVYLKESLDLELQKQDLNWVDGPDEATISLYSLNNDELIYQKVLPDDEASVGRNKIIDEKLTSPIPKEGIYKITITGNSDWTIIQLKINTNKIVLADRVLLLTPAQLYTQIKSTSELKIFIWHTTAINTDTITDSHGKITTYPLTKNDLNFDKSIELKPDNYIINLAGDQYISGGFFSFQKDQFFNPYIFNINTTNKADYYISNVNQLSSDNKKTGTYIVDISRLKQLDNVQNIKFELRNKALNQRFEKESQLLETSYNKITQIDSTVVWTNLSDIKKTTESSNIASFLKSTVPVGSSAFVDIAARINAKDFLITDKPEGFKESSSYITTINSALRGNQDFYVFVEKELKINITKKDLNLYKGTDVATVSLTDLDGHVLCKKDIKDDGNTTNNLRHKETNATLNCSTPSTGVYLLSIKGVKAKHTNIDSDFVIKKIKLNINKIVLKDAFLNTDPVTVYTNNRVDTSISMVYWHKEKAQKVLMSGSNSTVLKFTSANIRKTITYDLKKGDTQIVLQKGDIAIAGSNFSFTKDTWFNPNIVDIVTNKDSTPNFKFIKDTYPGKSFISNIAVQVE